MGTLSIWHWLLVILLILLIFGTDKLKNIGRDLGAAIKSFKKAVQEEEESTSNDKAEIAVESSANDASKK